VGAQSVYDISEIWGYLRQVVTSLLAQIIGSITTSVLELPQKYLMIADAVKTRSRETFDLLGLELVQFAVNGINPPASVQELIDKKSSMAIIGDMQRFMQFQTATAIEKAAENTGGAAGDGVGIGAGLGLGLVMPQAISSAISGANPMSSDAQTTSMPTASDRLKELKELLEADLIDQTTYEGKRDEIIQSL
jgi:membrane protease subunit (stomatin/prohibitin family)